MNEHKKRFTPDWLLGVAPTWTPRIIFLACLSLVILFVQALFLRFPLIASAHVIQPDKEPTLVVTGETGTGSAGLVVFLPLVSTVSPSEPPILTGDGTWPMAGANPQRTSWTSEEVLGDLTPEWFAHFEAYISQKVQIIAANNTLFISASDGLHALNSNSGREIWFYPTEMPLGNSPAYVDGIVYVGGFDHKIHAIDASTGQSKWTYQAGEGFHTNPLVVGGMLYAGNRDGYFYAIHTEGEQTGQLAWKFKTGGPILFSAAYADGVVFFASNDMYAYALDAASGNLVWKSAKLPGNGFHSWWPVIYGDYVIFPGTFGYRYVSPYGGGPHHNMERDVFPDGLNDFDPIGPFGTEPANWAPGTTTIDASAASQYFEANPHRRTYFVLRRSNGTEFTYDSDGDGRAEYAPILFFGTHSGTRYPPAVGPDNVIYQSNDYIYMNGIPKGHVSGWKVGTPYISMPTDEVNAVDEPMGYAIGGNTVYWKRCCDRKAGAFSLVSGNNTIYFAEGASMLRSYIPALFELGWDFAYWKHGDNTPPIPYNGRVYTINNNAVVALSEYGTDQVISSEDTGFDTGELVSEVEKSTAITGLNTKVTLDNVSWPLLYQQERYYELDAKATTRARVMRLVEVRGSDSSAPSALNVIPTNITTQLVSTYSGTQSLKTWISKRSPSVLFENSSLRYILAGDLVGIAYPTVNGIQVRTGNTSFTGNDLSEGWLLIWDETQTHRWAPLVVSLQNRPAQVTLDASGLSISYPEAAGYLAITPLYGMSAPLSSESTTWLSGIPTSTQERVRLLDRAARSFPSSSSDTTSIDPQSGDVELSYTYQYITYSDDWDTLPLQLANLPTHLALAAWNGSPILVNGQSLENWTDLEFVTPLGRVAGVENTTQVTARLPGLANTWRSVASTPTKSISSDPLQDELIAEVDKILAAGHLQPGFGMTGLWEAVARVSIGSYLIDYWHNPAETIYTLFRALPYLPVDRQSQVLQYIQSEFQSYPTYAISHAGWGSGASRDRFNLPPEVVAERASFEACGECNSWGFSPENHYASWLYARQFGDAAEIFNNSQAMFEPWPQFYQSFPYMLNSHLAGFIGYLRLADLANAGPQTNIESTLIDLLIKRAALSKYQDALAETGFEYSGNKWVLRSFAPNMNDTLFDVRIAGTLWSQMPLYGHLVHHLYGMSGFPTGGGYTFGIDFVNLVPEVAYFMQTYSRQEVREAVLDYETRAPYWFVANAEEHGGEGAIQPLYDVVSVFQAKAMILDEPRAELEKYLDIPAVAVGDLYYLQNIISTLEASYP